MIKTIQATNGTMTLEDLRNYTISAKPPLTITYRGYKLSAVGAPASGAVALGTLKTMEQYDLADSANVNLSTHRFAEAMRFAYGARPHLGDPDFLDNLPPYEHVMISETMAKEIRSRIMDNQTQPVSVYDPDLVYGAESHGTSHIVTADSDGMATTLTTTINLLFGAKIMAPDSGIIMFVSPVHVASSFYFFFPLLRLTLARNDEMNDFSIPGVPNAFGYQPSPANFIRPFKRPLSSVTPVIVEHPDGTLFVTVGAAGGSRIISSTTQILWHVLDHGMNMTEALARPRLHDQLMPNIIKFEWAFDNATVASMAAKGHNVTWSGPQSSVQGIMKLDDGTFDAASEPRQSNSGGLTT